MNIKQFLLATAFACTASLTATENLDLNEIAELLKKGELQKGQNVYHEGASYTIKEHSLQNKYKTECIQYILERPIKFLNMDLGKNIISVQEKPKPTCPSNPNPTYIKSKHTHIYNDTTQNYLKYGKYGCILVGIFIIGKTVSNSLNNKKS